MIAVLRSPLGQSITVYVIGYAFCYYAGLRRWHSRGERSGGEVEAFFMAFVWPLTLLSYLTEWHGRARAVAEPKELRRMRARVEQEKLALKCEARCRPVLADGADREGGTTDHGLPASADRADLRRPDLGVPAMSALLTILSWTALLFIVFGGTRWLDGVLARRRAARREREQCARLVALRRQADWDWLMEPWRFEWAVRDDLDRLDVREPRRTVRL